MEPLGEIALMELECALENLGYFDSMTLLPTADCQVTSHQFLFDRLAVEKGRNIQ